MIVKYNLIGGGKSSIESNNVTQFLALDTGGTRIYYLDGAVERFYDVNHPLEQVTLAIFRTSFETPAHAH